MLDDVIARANGYIISQRDGHELVADLLHALNNKQQIIDGWTQRQTSEANPGDTLGIVEAKHRMHASLPWTLASLRKAGRLCRELFVQEEAVPLK